MTAFNVLMVTEGMSQEDWLKYRRLGIGGSDISKIAGVNQYGNAVSVYLDKISQNPKDDDAGEAAYWGNRLEDVVASEFEFRTGLMVIKMNAILQSVAHPWMLGNVDRMIIDNNIGDGVLECKTTGVFTRAAKIYLEEDNMVDNDHMCQVQWYLGVTGYKYAYVAVLIGGQKFVTRKVERDDEIIEHLIKIGGDFWDLVQRREVPAIDGSDASSKLLDTIYKKSNQKKIDITGPESLDWAEKLISAREAIKAAEAQKQEAENHIKNMMRDFELADCGGYRFSWKTVVANRFDSKALENSHPELYKAFLKPSEYRRFEIKTAKKDGGLK